MSVYSYQLKENEERSIAMRKNMMCRVQMYMCKMDMCFLCVRTPNRGFIV